MVTSARFLLGRPLHDLQLLCCFVTLRWSNMAFRCRLLTCSVPSDPKSIQSLCHQLCGSFSISPRCWAAQFGAAQYRDACVCGKVCGCVQQCSLFIGRFQGRSWGRFSKLGLGLKGEKSRTPIVAMPPASEHCCSRSSMLVGTLPLGWDQPLIISETAFIVEAEGPRCTPGGGTGRDMAGEGPIKWSGRCVLYSLAFDV